MVMTKEFPWKDGIIEVHMWADGSIDVRKLEYTSTGFASCVRFTLSELQQITQWAEDSLALMAVMAHGY